MRPIILFTLIVGLFLTLQQTAAQQIDSTGTWEKTWPMKPDVFRVYKQGLIGIVNTQGTILVPCEFDQVYDLTDDNFVRVLKHLKIGLYHLEKGMILPAEYDQIWPFSGDLAKVLKDQKMGFVNKDGLMMVPCEFNHIWPEENGLIKVLKDGKMGYFDTAGRIVLPADYQQIWSFEEDLARVLKDGKMGYVDRNGNEVIPPIYDQVWAFRDGKAKAIQSGTIMYIDKQGRMVDAPQQSTIAPITTPDTLKNTAKPNQGIRIGPDFVEIHTKDGSNDITINDPKKRHKRSFEGHLAGVNLGLNSYLNANGMEEVPDDFRFMELNHEKSVEFAIYPFQQDIRLIGSHLGLVTALGLQYNNYRFDLASPADLNPTGLEWFPKMPVDANITKSKLTTLFLTVPALLEIQIPTRSNGHNTLYLSGGVEGGMRLRSHTKVIYSSGGDTFKRKSRDNFNMNGLRYSYIARVGYGNIGIFGSYTPVALFKNDKGPELYPFTVGISFNFD